MRLTDAISYFYSDMFSLNFDCLLSTINSKSFLNFVIDILQLLVMVIGLSVIQFKGIEANNFKSVLHYTLV